MDRMMYVTLANGFEVVGVQPEGCYVEGCHTDAANEAPEGSGEAERDASAEAESAGGGDGVEAIAGEVGSTG